MGIGALAVRLMATTGRIAGIRWLTRRVFA